MPPRARCRTQALAQPAAPSGPSGALAPSPTPSAEDLTVWAPRARRAASAPPHGFYSVLPSFALQHEEANSSTISAPLRTAPLSAQARIAGYQVQQTNFSIFDAAKDKHPATLKCCLEAQPLSVSLWHPRGYNLLHWVIRQRRLQHIDIVLEAAQSLDPQTRSALLDGVDNDGLDAVLLAIKQRSVFLLAKLLGSGCDPTRRRYRRRPAWVVRMVHPLQASLEVEDASVYAIRKCNADALDLLLLWDERRVLCATTPHCAFDIAELVVIATSIRTAKLRHLMLDALQAARRRRAQLAKNSARVRTV